MQLFDIKYLEITKDILVDELSQGIQINENMKDKAKITDISKIHCHNWITKKLVKETHNMIGDSDSSDIDDIMAGQPNKNKNKRRLRPVIQIDEN